MIVFDLQCHAGGHRFEGWFGSSQDFTQQQERGLLACPECGSDDVGKAVMAPSVGKKGNRGAGPVPAKAEAMSTGALPPEAVKMMKQLAKMQSESLKDSRWVGESFAEDARAMHYGEQDSEAIHGQTTLEEAKNLIDEGIEVAPLPLPVVPPDKAN
ncbi:MAG: DUF1178 family protein [Sphingomonadaceae bacterium]|nr:DUF1178 family protein [Sphingomonadaceae bacterium]